MPEIKVTFLPEEIGIEARLLRRRDGKEIRFVFLTPSLAAETDYDLAANQTDARALRVF